MHTLSLHVVEAHSPEGHDPGNEKLVSPASYWEIVIKISLSKYTLLSPYEKFMEKAMRENGFVVVPVELKYTAVLTTLRSTTAIFSTDSSLCKQWSKRRRLSVSIPTC